MAQAKKKTATRTAKKTTARKSTSCKGSKSCGRSKIHYEKYQRGQKSNMFFVISMTVLAATLLFADMFMMVA